MTGAAGRPGPSEKADRLELIEFVRRVHGALPDCDLPARHLLEVRRDLVFLAAEARRDVFRPAVVQAVRDAILHEVGPVCRRKPPTST